MDVQGSVDPAPQVGMLNVNSSAKVFPDEVIFSPPGKRFREGANHVTVAAKQHHRRWPLDALEAPYRRQQGQSIEVTHFRIVSRENWAAVGTFQGERPGTLGE